MLVARIAGASQDIGELRDHRCGAWSSSFLTVNECHPRPRLPSAPMAKKYKDVRKTLADAGWRVLRQRGSHEIWAHPDSEERIVVAGKDSDTVPVGTLGSIRRASGLEHLR
jgi:predicted RNA binding protein YcfA (HicA-like mRNA interferase family)